MSDERETTIRSAADRMEFSKRLVAEIGRIVPDIELRKWIVNELLGKCVMVDEKDFVKSCEAIYAFVTGALPQHPVVRQEAAAHED